MKVMADGYASFGEVFTVPLLHKNLTFLIGPTVAPHFFKATDDEMSQTEVRARYSPYPKRRRPTYGDALSCCQERRQGLPDRPLLAWDEAHPECNHGLIS